MTYGTMVTVAAPIEAYEALHAEILRAQGDVPAQGLLVHFARTTAGGFQVVEVWETKEDSDRFDAEVVQPVVQRVMAGAQEPASPPQVEEFEVLGLMTTPARTATT